MLFSIITRCYRRPVGLRRCKLSLALQTDQDFEHVLLVDDVGIGFRAADVRLVTDAPALINGDYVYVLDDDNLIIDNSFVARIRWFAQEYDPDVIMVKSDHGRTGILPSPEVWRRRPIAGQIDTLNAIVRSEIWKRHIGVLATCQDDARDAAFFAELFNHGYKIRWLDKIVAMSGSLSGRGYGQVEW